MRIIGLFLVVFVSLLAVACGGGGSPPEETPSGPTAAPTPTATRTTSSSSATIVEITISDTGLLPQTLEIVAGKPYKFRLVNTSTKSRTLVIRRWEVVLTAAPGEKQDTGTITDSEANAEATCHEQSRGSRPEFQCTIKIVPAK